MAYPSESYALTSVRPPLIYVKNRYSSHFPAKIIPFGSKSFLRASPLQNFFSCPGFQTDMRFSDLDLLHIFLLLKGERLMQEGLLGHKFYILEDGECTMYKKIHESSPQQLPAGRSVKSWEIFGDSDVFYNARRVWSCKCVQPGVVRQAMIFTPSLIGYLCEICTFSNSTRNLKCQNILKIVNLNCKKLGSLNFYHHPPPLWILVVRRKQNFSHALY